MKPICFRCGKESKELSRVNVKWNTYKGSGSCTAYLCNDCVDAIEPEVSVLVKNITLNLNKDVS